jgi:hypothetical protein
MRDPLLDRPVVLGARRAGSDLRPSGRPREFGTAVEHAVLGPDRGGVIAGAGIRAGRMAGDQVVDLETVLDHTNPLFEGLDVPGLCHVALPPTLRMP